MSGLKIKQEWMQKTVVVWFGALFMLSVVGKCISLYQNRISAV